MTPSLSYPITNRDFKLPDDGWYHVAPVGTYDHPTGVKQVLDQKSMDAMVNAFREDEKDPHFPGLLVDYDHFSNNTATPSEAAGWIHDLKNRTDGPEEDHGLWAKITWSDTGLQAVQGKRYRLVSPVWNRSDSEKLEDGAAIRPLRLDRVAITNDPNLKGMTPLSNRSEKDEPEDEALKNYGTSAGAKKGWETRRTGGSARAATKTDLKKAKPVRAKAAPKSKRMAIKTDLKSKKPISTPEPAPARAATKTDLVTSGYRSDLSASEQGGAESEAFMQRRRRS